MRTIVLLLLLAVSTFAVERPSNESGPFYDSTLGFENAFMPILTSFEKAKIETTRRGFFSRGDYPGAFENSKREPSDEGLFLQVDVTENVKVASDETKQVGVYARRFIQIPSGRTGVQDLQIEFSYGINTPKGVLKAVNGCIDHIKRIASASLAKKHHRS